MRLTCNTIKGEAELRLQRDVSEGEIYLEDMEEPLEDCEYAELYYDTASNDESDALIGYIAKYLCGEVKDKHDRRFYEKRSKKSRQRKNRK